MKYVKLTDSRIQTYNGCQWKIGRKNTTSGEGDICGPGWLHCYGADTLEQAALLAVLLNPIHANFDKPKMFEAEVGGKTLSDNGVKYGFTEMTLKKEMEIPTITAEQKVAFGILCALEINLSPDFVRWAEDWLSGKNRSIAAANAARAAADAEAAARSAADAAAAADWAAEAAARSAEAEAEAEAASVWAASRAADAAAAAAAATAATKYPLNLGELAEKAFYQINF